MPIEPASKNGPHQDRSEKVVGTHGAGQQTAPCSEKAQVSPMQLQRSQMRARRRRGSQQREGWRFLACAEHHFPPLRRPARHRPTDRRRRTKKETYLIRRSHRPWTDSAAVKCPYSGGAARRLDVLRQYKSVSRLAERGRPEDGKEGGGMLSVIGPEHGAASEAECGAGEVANGGRERGKSRLRGRFEPDPLDFR